MAIVTDITKLSQTAALNGPDGAVDPPNVLDDQDRYLGSFIAMLRDGVGFTAGAAIVAIGFTPVRQGGNSTGTTTNIVSVGYNSTLGRLVCAVDTNQFGNVWPIDAQDALQMRSGGTRTGGLMTFTWSGQAGSPGYVWGGNDGTNMFVYQPGQMSVNYANSAGSATSAGTASNANAVNGISGWSYTNQNYNPPYLWATAGSGGSQFLVQPGNLTVAYANSAGSAPANGGTAANSNALGGQGYDWFINGAGSAVRNLRNNGVIQMIAGVAGVGDMFWGANVSDARLKTGVEPTQADSLSQVMQMRFVGYRWRDDMGFEIGDDTFNPVGVLAHEAEEIEPKWINNKGTWKQPEIYAMLMSTMHAVQQLGEKLARLESST